MIRAKYEVVHAHYLHSNSTKGLSSNIRTDDLLASHWYLECWTCCYEELVSMCYASDWFDVTI